MFNLENTKLNKMIKSSFLVSALFASTSLMALEKNVDGSVIYPVKDGAYTAYKVNTQKKGEFGFGRIATKNEIQAWDIDVKYNNEGLPKYDVDKHGKPMLDKPAKGSVEQGDELYAAQCVMCHGEFGLGGKGYPTLAGGGATTESLTNQLGNPADDVPGEEGPKKTIGTNWPYASTLFWYIKSAMPFPHPKSLTNSEVYALVAYLLSINEVEIDGQELDDEYVLDYDKFQKIHMPNENGFYPEVNGPDGVENMKKFLTNTKNYGTGTRCMTDCKNYTKLEIKQELNDFIPPMNTAKDLPPVDNATMKPGQADYEASCSSCHSNAAIGAPVVGNKEAWKDVMDKGLDKVYHNAINGINGMPPKGGTDFSDEKMKTIINYMIEASK
jgi:cytochrome c